MCEGGEPLDRAGVLPWQGLGRQVLERLPHRLVDGGVRKHELWVDEDPAATVTTVREVLERAGDDPHNVLRGPLVEERQDALHRVELIVPGNSAREGCADHPAEELG